MNIDKYDDEYYFFVDKCDDDYVFDKYDVNDDDECDVMMYMLFRWIYIKINVMMTMILINMMSMMMMNVMSWCICCLDEYPLR